METHVSIVGCGPVGRLMAAAAAAAGLRVELVCMRLRSLHKMPGGKIRLAHQGGVAEARVQRLSLLEAKISSPLVIAALHSRHLDQLSKSLGSSVEAVLYTQPSPAVERILRSDKRAGVMALYGCAWENRESGNAVEYALKRIAFAPPPRSGAARAYGALESITDALRLFNIDSVVQGHEARISLLWDHVAAHAATQPVAATLGAPFSRIAGSRHGVALVDSLAREVLLLMDEKKVGMIRSPVDAAREVLGVKGCRPKMMVDLEEGRETEVDYINGYIVKEAIRYGIYAPYNDAVYLQVKTLEDIALSQ